MSATTAVKTGRPGRLGVMVRTPEELYVYWRPFHSYPRLALRITDLTGRPTEELLDGCGFREMEAAQSVYVSNLLPGHLYVAEIGQTGAEGFVPLLSAGPVQTPWVAGAADSSEYPAPFHRS